MNFAQYVAIPKKLHTLVVDVGGLALWIACTFWGSGEIPFSENTKPKNVKDLLLNSRLGLFSDKFTAENLLNTACSALSWSV